jgi:AAA domain (dynein-related subfamily)
MSRAKWCGEVIYAEADRFRESCLRRDGSLLVPAGADLWTAERVHGLEDLITPVQGGSFLDNLLAQLEGRSEADRLLVTEGLYLLLLFGLDTSAEKKIEHLERLLSELRDPVALSKPMTSALRAGGVANFSAGNAWRHAYLRFIFRFAQRLKDQPGGQREETLSDPWKCHGLSQEVRTSTDAMAANCLLHVLFPETFEYVVGEAHRTQLVEAFAAAPGVRDAPSTDARIQRIRELAQSGQADPIDFYESPFVDIWKHQPSVAWSETVRLGALLYEDANFDTEERSYKLEIADALREARRALLAGEDDWTDKLKRGIQHSKNNLTSWRGNPTIVKWFADNERDGRALLSALWAHDRRSVEDRLLDFLRDLPREAMSGDSTRLAMASLLLLAVDPYWQPFYKLTVATRFSHALGRNPDDEVAVDPESITRPEQLAARLGVEQKRVRDVLRSEYPRDETERGREWHLTSAQVSMVIGRLADAGTDDIGTDKIVARYSGWKLLLEELRLRMLAAGRPLRDLLDAQGLAYALVQWDVPRNWNEADKAALLAWREGKVAGDDDVVIDVPTPTDGRGLPPVPQAMADDLFMPQAWLQRIVDLLGDKRQLILYGPPGTGKTFLASRLGRHITESGGSAQLVQFHPSYTYEDFFEGYRPHADTDGALKFKIIHGVLRDVARRAREEPNAPHLLIIDEINRGNLPKIFGELYFLLEYRDHAVRLQYSDDEFTLPKNLYILGTMNTADKSIALVDAALRRRFYFVGLMPTKPPVREVLARWLAARSYDPMPAALLDELNAEIADADFSIGPSYLMTDPKNLEQVWEHGILPLLEEHFYGSGQDISQRFGLEALKSRIAARAETTGDPETDTDA